MEPLSLNLTQVKISSTNKVRNTMWITTINQREMFLFIKFIASIISMEHERFQQIPVRMPALLSCLQLAYLQLHKQVHDDSLR